MRKIIFAILALTVSSAQAIIIDFEDQGVAPGTQINPAPTVGIISGGYGFAPGPINVSCCNDLHIHNENGIGDNGSTHLGSHDDIEMQAITGAFSIQSFDFEGFLTESNIEVVGELLGGGSISTTFLADLNPATYETFSFTNAWTDLTRVFFNYQGNGSNGFFVDNIVVTETTPIPEPAALALFAIGLAGFSVSRKNKK